LSKGGPGGVGSPGGSGTPESSPPSKLATSLPLDGGGTNFGELSRTELGWQSPGNSPDTSPPSQGGARGGNSEPIQSPPVAPAPARLKPRYDAMLHELYLGAELVKRFTRPAKSQELILAAFQEDDWPPAIDDPLPAQFNQDPKRHLHYTIRNLNRGQKPLRIRFVINGNDETIRWQGVPFERAKSAHGARRGQ